MNNDLMDERNNTLSKTEETSNYGKKILILQAKEELEKKRKELDVARANFNTAQSQHDKLVNSCLHVWTTPVEGRNGWDERLWSRECEICGRKDATTKYRSTVSYEPIFQE